jgi:peptidoglycan/xylan/chitin deacetylase (PgdA/CDA1 family)
MMRHKLARALDRAHVPSILLTLRSRGISPWVSAIVFHRVASECGELDPGTADVAPDAFDRHVEFMARWFQIVGIDDFIGYANGDKAPKNPLLITFDDGYRDNHDVALPILLKHGARATFFIATKYIEERRLFWWDKISLLVRRSKRTQIDLTYPIRKTFSLADDKERERTRVALLHVPKETFALDIDRFLDDLAEAAGVAFSREDERKIADDVVMTWDQVRGLKRAGMDVQSHTVSHRVVEMLDDATLEQELVDSRAKLEQEVGTRVRALAYPVGRHGVLPANVRAVVKKTGYEVAFSNATGADLRWGIDAMNASRIGVDFGDPDSFFRSIMAVPPLAY